MPQPAPTIDPAEFAALETDALIQRYADGVHTLDPRLLQASDEQLSTYFRPEAGVGRWSCRALVVHLADSEQCLVHRMRRVACEDRPVLTIWDEDAFIDACVSDGAEGNSPPPVAGAVGVVHATRLWTRDWLRSLDDGAWSRVALHPEKGEQTLRDILQYNTWHLEHHGAILKRKLDLLLGPADDGDGAP
ncbi:MAG: hypothetical protein Tsb0013_15260 [Phycisphaerales bacterium]